MKQNKNVGLSCLLCLLRLAMAFQELRSFSLSFSRILFLSEDDRNLTWDFLHVQHTASNTEQQQCMVSFEHRRILCCGWFVIERSLHIVEFKLAIMQLFGWMNHSHVKHVRAEVSCPPALRHKTESEGREKRGFLAMNCRPPLGSTETHRGAGTDWSRDFMLAADRQ